VGITKLSWGTPLSAHVTGEEFAFELTKLINSCSQTNPLKHKRLARAVFYLTQEGGSVTLMKGLSRVMLMFVFSSLKVWVGLNGRREGYVFYAPARSSRVLQFFKGHALVCVLFIGGSCRIKGSRNGHISILFCFGAYTVFCSPFLTVCPRTKETGHL
jgi:hypothetical protein